MYHTHTHTHTEVASCLKLHCRPFTAQTDQNPSDPPPGLSSFQGMNFIAGYLLIITKDEEKSFWLMDALIGRILPGMPTADIFLSFTVSTPSSPPISIHTQW